MNTQSNFKYSIPGDENDPLYMAMRNGFISVAVYNALKRSGYGEQFGFDDLKKKLTDNTLNVRGLGVGGISQLKHLLINMLREQIREREEEEKNQFDHEGFERTNEQTSKNTKKDERFSIYFLPEKLDILIRVEAIKRKICRSQLLQMAVIEYLERDRQTEKINDDEFLRQPLPMEDEKIFVVLSQLKKRNLLGG